MGSVLPQSLETRRFLPSQFSPYILYSKSAVSSSPIWRRPGGGFDAQPPKLWIAREGFSYRTAYFQDFDGKYYSFTISVGRNNGVNTIYNVNQIKEAELPYMLKGTQPQKATVGLTASNVTITEGDADVNKRFSLKAEPKEADTSEENKQLQKTAAEILGRAYNGDVAGYLLPDGTRLDFSGKREGRDQKKSAKKDGVRPEAGSGPRLLASRLTIQNLYRKFITA